MKIYCHLSKNGETFLPSSPLSPSLFPEMRAFSITKSLAIRLVWLIGWSILASTFTIKTMHAFRFVQEYGSTLSHRPPKPLADLFESVAAAIYLDSNLSEDVLWNIIYPFLKPYIDTELRRSQSGEALTPLHGSPRSGSTH